MSGSRIALIIVGAAAIILALLGLCYNSMTLFADFSEMLVDGERPYFYHAFYSMSVVCIIFYVTLISLGIGFIRGKHNLLKPFIVLLVIEVVYFFSIGMTWIIPGVGMSIAGATGVANGGLMFQSFILFPLWAPLVVFFASRRIQQQASNQAVEATE